jgi:F420-non-reducing hydrogenase small subunit
MPEKPKLSVYWASSCGGCEIALVNLHEKILEIDRHFDFIFCPCLLDTKRSDIEALDDGSIALTFFNGAIRTSENQEMAHLLRKKSQLLIAYGSCASEGCIPALSNLSTRADHIRTNYWDSPSLDNPRGMVPQTVTITPEGELELPAFFETVKTLSQVVEVDYFLPGCPPESHQIWAVVESVIQGKALPPRHSVVGAGRSTVCDECGRQRTTKAISTFHRTYEIIPDPSQCLLEQGLVCMGIATRDGCGALCPAVNMPCTGCYGPPEGVVDSGAKMLAALGSVLDLGGYKGLTEDQVAQKTDAILAGIPDPAGTFYQYSLAGSLLRRRMP